MSKEDIERLLDAAADGDLDAAYAIGEIYREAESAGWYDKALPWYEQAANGGHQGAMLFALAIHKAKAVSAKEEGDLDAMIYHAVKVIGLCGVVFEEENAPQILIDEACEKYEHAAYLVALERYIRNDYKAALHRLDGIEKMPVPLMQILHGCAMFDDALQTGSLTYEVVKTVYEALCLLEHKPETFVVGEIDDADAFVLSSGFFYLSSILRNAPINDVQRAYSLLKKGVEFLPEGQGRDNLVNELKCYQQKFFGGVQYVG